VSLFRRLSTRVLALVAAAVVIGGVGAVVAVKASGGSGPTPAPKPLAQAIQDALNAPSLDGVTARIRFTNHLIASGSLNGTGSPLLSGATGRLWATADGHIRLELQSDAGDAQIISDGKTLTVYDASSNTVYKVALPAQPADTGAKDSGTPPTLANIQSTLTELASYADLSGATPDSIAGQPAYTLRATPKHDGGLLGAVEIGWDAVHGVPLRAAIYAQGDSSPVLELTATDISFGKVSSADVNVAPPAGAKVVDLSPPAGKDANGKDKQPVTGVAGVSAAVPFALQAPDTLVGLPRQEVRLVDAGGTPAAAVVYGQGLGAIVVLEQQPDAKKAGGSSPLDQLPQVSINGATGHELPTALGTIIQFEKNGVAFTLVGSLPPSAAEAAARALVS
jgi:outer membrane lipoprotein-sorting protein